MGINREISIDALRGIAIIGMVLSGTITQNPELPAWLFHAQVGPVDFKFHPDVPGITWVDLVFPFFLFAMGLSIPFSLNRLINEGVSRKQIIRKVVVRALKLFFFAVLLGHLSPFNFPVEAGVCKWLFAIFTFLGFFMAFGKISFKSINEKGLNRVGYLLLLVLLILRKATFGLPISIHKNDIIILVLANMALFGALIWLFTQKNWYTRLFIIAIYLGFRLTSDIEESWAAQVWNFTPIRSIGSIFTGVAGWLGQNGVDTQKVVFYSSNFVKYLFIVLPGTIAGDLLYRLNLKENKENFNKNRTLDIFQIITYSLLIVCNLIGLFNRLTAFVLFSNTVLISISLYLVSSPRFKFSIEIINIIKWSAAWLVIGLVLEPFEGGIKKDHATLSYFFVTSGIAGYALLIFRLTHKNIKANRYLNFIPSIGQNPMVGYVAAAYLIIPILGIMQLLDFVDSWHTVNKWLGLIRGLLLTSIMILITTYTVKRKWFWKT